MNTLPALRRIALAALLHALGGCQMPPPAAEIAAPQVDAPCVITDAAYAHISARHCDPASGASQLLPDYCSRAGMLFFCRMVQNAQNQTRVVQGDNRIRYDSNLDRVVGTAGEKCGRLVTTSAANGDVITEFPELAGAPGVCH